MLVVDDNPRIHEDFRKILAAAGGNDALDAAEAALFGAAAPKADCEPFEIDSAYQGESAVFMVETALALSAPYAVAFVDLRMPPGWDGVRTVRAMWRADPDVQVVLCTAYSDYSWEEMTDELGARSGFLILKKPFDAIEVRQLAQSLAVKWSLQRENAGYLRSLEDQVQSRTEKLAAALEQLRSEMTERLRLEKEFRQAQKLDALGRLIASIGHEINNPLTYVMSNLEFARADVDRLRGDLQGERLTALSEALEEAAAGAERIRRTVAGTREFARPLEEAPRSIDVRACFQAAARIVKNPLLHRAKLIEVYEDVPRVMADPHRLEQVFVNLLTNALHALPDGKDDNEIRVATVCEGGAQVVTTIQDNGRGIDERDLPHVFDPFFSTHLVGQGTGLGLWICRKIVESFGGKIELNSELGRGTAAHVTLPVAASPRVSAPPSGPPSEPRRRCGPARILIIDDEPSILHSMRRALREHQVSITTDAREALRLYQAREFDLVFCDLMMPGFGGMEFLEEIQRIGPEHAGRVVIMTGGVFADEIRDALARVNNACISKPFSNQVLLRTVEEQLAVR